MKKRNFKSLNLNKHAISTLALATKGGHMKLENSSNCETYVPECNSKDHCYTDDCTF